MVRGYGRDGHMLAFRLGLESTRSSRSLRNGHFIFPPMAFDAENAAN